MKTSRFIVLLVLWVSVGESGIAQGPMGMQARPLETPGVFYLEALQVPSPDTSVSRIDILYRIDREFFVPVRRTGTAANGPFQRRGEVLVELFDSAGVSRGRHIERIEIEDEGTPLLTQEKKWHQGLVSLTVAPGTYRLLYEATDLESQRKYLNDRMAVVARRYTGSLQAGDILFVNATDLRDTLAPDNYGGDVLFSEPHAALMHVRRLDTNAPVSISYKITMTTPGTRDTTTLLQKDPAAFALRTGAFYAIHQGTDSKEYRRSTDSGMATSVLLIPIDTQVLPLRSFHLSIRIVNGTRELTVGKAFRTVWPSMPLSLKDVDRALEVLRYITRESQLDSMRRGSFEDRMNNLEAFWKAKDPTPETASNDVMTEYYRRVDRAVKEFATLRQLEGWRTDRGRIFILYGPPASVERTLDPVAGFREVWKYDRLAKQFTFVDRAKNGEYILMVAPKQ